MNNNPLLDAKLAQKEAEVKKLRKELEIREAELAELRRQKREADNVSQAIQATSQDAAIVNLNYKPIHELTSDFMFGVCCSGSSIKALHLSNVGMAPDFVEGILKPLFRCLEWLPSCLSCLG